MRYAIRDESGNIVNTIVCDDPEFAKELGAEEYPYPGGHGAVEPTPAEQREEAYNTQPIIEWEGQMLTVTQAAQKWQYYAAEGSQKADELQVLISAAKESIREQCPDEEVSE